MLYLLFLLSLVINLFLAAASVVNLDDLQSGNGKTLKPRQVLLANPSVACCTSCSSAYTYNTYWNVFDDFCTWAGNGLELWTSQSYYTGSYYCEPGADTCIHLYVKYLCGGGSAYAVSYSGCMSYFLFTINPARICGGSPYPGAKIESADNCWIFRATADSSASASSSAVVACDSGRSCDDAEPVAAHSFASTSD